MTKLVEIGLSEKLNQYAGKTLARIHYECNQKTGACLVARFEFTDGTALEIQASVFFPDSISSLPGFPVPPLPTLKFGVE